MHWEFPWYIRIPLGVYFKLHDLTNPKGEKKYKPKPDDPPEKPDSKPPGDNMEGA